MPRDWSKTRLTVCAGKRTRLAGGAMPVVQIDKIQGRYLPIFDKLLDIDIETSTVDIYFELKT